jgi:multimeric flavodoxin WrbA
MKVLGIVGSCRRLGNTEILVKEALMKAQELGAEVDIIRWTDYNILPCEGDATCMFMGKECKHKAKDGHDFLLQMMYGFDGVILGAPCYILEVEAVVKQFIDRLFVLSSQPSRMIGKPAAIIVPYATRGWTTYAFLQPTIVLHQLGMHVIDKVLVHIQAMSQASANQHALAKARKVGAEIIYAIKTGDHSYKGDPGICPVCHERNIRIMKDNKTVECGICAIRGKLTLEGGEIKVSFPQEQLDWHRFAFESLYRHVTYEIKPSKDFFIKNWPDWKEKRRKYKEYLDINHSAQREGETK